MPKLKLLILDAGVVIRLHELGIWSQVLNHCEIHLSRIVAEKEVLYQQGDEYDEDIDLSADINGGRIQVVDVAVSELRDFRNQFDPLYLGDLDDGEAESLTAAGSRQIDGRVNNLLYRIMRWQDVQLDVEKREENFEAAIAALQNVLRISDQVTEAGNYQISPCQNWFSVNGAWPISKTCIGTIQTFSMPRSQQDFHHSWPQFSLT